MREITQQQLEEAVLDAGDRIVYFLQVDPGGPIKIGYSRRGRNFERRIAALQSASAWPLKVTRTFPGTKSLEQRLHIVFAALRMRGEWFYPDPELCAVAHAALPDRTERA